MSLLKYRNGGTPADTKLFWGRSAEDGAPFRGPAPPLLRNEEFERFSERVFDAKYGMFDASNPEQKLPQGHPQARSLAEVLEGFANGWFRILSHNEHWSKGQDGTPRMFVFLIWLEQYMELPEKHTQGGASHASPPTAGNGFL